MKILFIASLAISLVLNIILGYLVAKDIRSYLGDSASYSVPANLAIRCVSEPFDIVFDNVRYPVIQKFEVYDEDLTGRSELLLWKELAGSMAIAKKNGVASEFERKEIYKYLRFTKISQDKGRFFLGPSNHEHDFAVELDFKSWTATIRHFPFKNDFDSTTRREFKCTEIH